MEARVSLWTSLRARADGEVGATERVVVAPIGGLFHVRAKPPSRLLAQNGRRRVAEPRPLVTPQRTLDHSATKQS